MKRSVVLVLALAPAVPLEDAEAAKVVRGVWAISCATGEPVDERLEPLVESSTIDEAAEDFSDAALTVDQNAPFGSGSVAVSAPSPMSSMAQLMQVVHGSAPLRLKVLALQELAEREALELTPYLRGQLARADLAPGWACALLWAAERAPVTGIADGQALCDLLLRRAEEIEASDAADTQAAVWAAMRRIGALADGAFLPRLGSLLGTRDARTRQATLQAIAQIATATGVSAPTELVTRVRQLVDKHLDPDWLVSGANIALAANAVRALAALQGSEARTELRGRVEALRRPALEALCRPVLNEA